MGVPKCLFSYYGGKSKVARLYPPPRFPLIVEPFGGSAAYAYHHSTARALVNDLKPAVRQVYAFLRRPDAADWVSALVRPAYAAGDFAARDVLAAGGPEGLAWWLALDSMSGKYQPTIERPLTPWAAVKGLAHARSRYLTIIAATRRWEFTGGDYRALPDVEATWFIDPPYSGQPGRVYQMPALDYDELAEWCRTRKGQVIVCEDASARWLPFRRLSSIRGMRVTTEGVWVNDPAEIVGVNNGVSLFEL